MYIQYLNKEQSNIDYKNILSILTKILYRPRRICQKLVFMDAKDDTGIIAEKYPEKRLDQGMTYPRT